MDLKSAKCVPCQAGEPQLTKEEISLYLQKVSGWSLETGPNKIVKTFVRKDFKSAIAFVNKVADLAENEGHHPNLCIHDFKNVKLEIWTHKINGLHKNDFILASKIDDVA
jgi:4a-hydroxytetrahydrobiopterin dehydratase